MTSSNVSNVWTGLEEVVQCSSVQRLNLSDQCAFVSSNPDCLNSGGFVNYIQFYYCRAPGTRPEVAVLLAAWLVVLFVTLAIAADNFFCPNLATIAKNLRLSQNIAGVTILAFGNGSADIFSSMAGVSQRRPELVLGELFGAAAFLTTVVAGAVCITTPFQAMERPFLRDVVFCIGAGFWAFYIFYRGKIYLFDAIGFLALYVLYITVVLVGRYINQRHRRQQRLGYEALRGEDDRRSGVTEDEDLGEEGDLSIFVPRSLLNHPPSLQQQQPITDADTTDSGASTPTLQQQEEAEANATLDNLTPPLVVVHESCNDCAEGWRRFARRLSPIDPDSFGQMSRLRKLRVVLQSPIILVLNLTVPVVDEDLPERGWCQRLHVIQCLLAPLFIVLVAGVATAPTFLGLELWQVMLTVGQTLAIFLQCTSVVGDPPGYQPLLAYLGFGSAVVWIYAVANEIVSLLKTLGIVMGLSDAILGLTVLAWGNSLGDLIADVAIARQGFPRTGFSACFGGPLFNMLLGIGIPFTYAIAVNNGGEPIVLQYDPMVLVLSVMLAVALLSALLLLPLLKFKASKGLGCFMVLLYLVLISVAITVEFTVIT